MAIDLTVALGVWLVGYALFGRFVAPRWKVAGKLIFYLVVAWALTRWFGHWSLIWIVGHPALGIGGHIWWCRRHSIDWLTCQPRHQYLQIRPWAATDGFATGTKRAGDGS